MDDLEVIMFIILKSKSGHHTIYHEGSDRIAELINIGYWEVARADTIEDAISKIENELAPRPKKTKFPMPPMPIAKV